MEYLFREPVVIKSKIFNQYFLKGFPGQGKFVQIYKEPLGLKQ